MNNITNLGDLLRSVLQPTADELIGEEQDKKAERKAKKESDADANSDDRDATKE